jgi:hypothetical protein
LAFPNFSEEILKLSLENIYKKIFMKIKLSELRQIVKSIINEQIDTMPEKVQVPWIHRTNRNPNNEGNPETLPPNVKSVNRLMYITKSDVKNIPYNATGTEDDSDGLYLFKEEFALPNGLIRLKGSNEQIVFIFSCKNKNLYHGNKVVVNSYHEAAPISTVAFINNWCNKIDKIYPYQDSGTHLKQTITVKGVTYDYN